MPGHLTTSMLQPIAGHPGKAPGGMRLWNVRQMNTFLRWGSRYRVPLTADVVAPLASRYAEKHAITRPRLLRAQQGA